MRALKAILAVMIIALVVVSFGCSKKNPTSTTNNNNNNTIPSQQTQAATAGADLASSCDSDINDWSGFLSGSSWKKGGKDVIDSMWWGPNAGGWYTWYFGNTGTIYRPSGDTTGYVYRWQIKFTPDVWATPAADYPDTFEWYLSYHDTSVGVSTFHLKIGYDYDNQHLKGFWVWNIRSAAYNYGWSFTFDSVSVASNDYQGHYVLSCNYWPYLGADGYHFGVLTGSYHFASNGSGTGTLSLNSVEVVRYVFYAEGNNPRGYYTLAEESWATQHTFAGKK